MNVGYSYWGFLADIKMNDKYEAISTPDGNAFYSWSIIKEMQRRGHKVIALMPDRDKYAVERLNGNAFASWCKADRYNVYDKMIKPKYSSIDERSLFSVWDNAGLRDAAYVLHEWRMLIPGRNDHDSRNNPNWQPDYFIQSCVLKYCRMYGIKLFIFDLDYKLDARDLDGLDDIVTVVELGDKWSKQKSFNAVSVYIPFDFSNIHYFGVKGVDRRTTELVYVGNRYERDWCIDKYIPTDLSNCVVYGNWKESGRDSVTRWPLITFGSRLQLADMHDVYSDAVCTVLLAKKEYCDMHFMTARVVEAIFYGCMPLFIREYGDNTIRRFAGKYSNLLCVKSKQDVVNKINKFKNNAALYDDVITYLRSYLTKMDVTGFINTLEEE